MSKAIITESLLTDIANAIRNKTGDISQMTPAQMAVAISNISSGGEADYENALVALGVSSDLADSIEALTAYANEITGANDANLSDAVRTLTDGYSDSGSEVNYDDVTLPSEYQRVEYIESTGTQYIDLPFGFYPTDEICSVLAIDTTMTQEKWMVASRTWNNNNNRFAFGGIQMGTFGVGYGAVGTDNTVIMPLLNNDGGFYTHTYKEFAFFIKESGTGIFVHNITFGTETTNIRLFFGYDANTNGKIRYYVHKKANTLAIALYACYRKADGVIGMYDTVNDIFYTNNGTGTFNKGANI